MGGQGSGRWHRPNRKKTVDKCLSIDVSQYACNIDQCTSGEISWINKYSGEAISSIGYMYLPENEMEQMLILSYKNGNNTVQEPVSFQKTNPHFGGNRWWFTCPLCKRRIGKLYLPAKGQYFACRKCYDLGYRSSRC
jgi:hypothetical protein